VGAAERDEWLRAAWRLTLAQQIDPQRLVFVDEMGANTSLSSISMPIHRRDRGRTVLGSAQPRAEHDAALMHERGGYGSSSLTVEGATNRDVFEAYVERVLSPELRPGQVVVMDNLTAHKGERVKELIEGRGCELLYLPPYSPDFNPIEEAFSKIKAVLRKVEARTREGLVEAMGIAISAVSAHDARGFFEHCGYRPRVQLL
jgi:transposase